MSLLVLLLFNCVLNEASYEGSHSLVLNDESSTIDGSPLTGTASNGVSILPGENIIHYEKEYADVSGYGETTDETEMHSKEDCNKEKLVTISEAGIYIVSGSLKGQLAIDLPEAQSTQSVTLVLKGVNIECSVAPGLIFYNVNEIDSTQYEDSKTSITYSKASQLNFDDAGGKLIIADDTTNTITGSHVAECYQYTTNTDGSITVTTNQRAKYGGAIYSKMSISIKGESKGNGILNVIADSEGIEIAKHLLIESGNINVASQEDGINTNEDGGSVTLIKGGNLKVNAGLNEEGDGIDSNGYLIISGGTVISAAKPQSDSGLDADLGVIINEGTVVGVGSTMDGASNESSQPTMNLKFSSQMSSNKDLIVKDSNGNTLLTFNPSSAGFVDGTDVRTYQGAIISHPSFELNGVYYLYLGDTQLGYNGQDSQNSPGNIPNNGETPPNMEGENNGGTPPNMEGENNGGTPPNMEGKNNTGNAGTPPNMEGKNNTGNGGTPPNMEGKNNTGNGGTPPNMEGENNGQSSTNTSSMTKEFILTSTATTFNGVGVYSESSSADNSNGRSSLLTYIGIASVVLLSSIFYIILSMCVI